MRGIQIGRCSVATTRKDVPDIGLPETMVLRSFERQVAAEWPVANWQNLHVVLAVSGGADSMALLRAVLTIKAAAGGTGRVVVGHFNHGLRGNVAQADANWLHETCRRLGVLFEVGHGDVKALAADVGDGVEAAARAARYEFLLKTAERLGARFVVTAHTANDQAETVLHRIIRGTGLAGMAGIPAVRPLSASVTLVRPMLTTYRSEVVEYLAAIGQDFREDSSNADLQPARNRLRHEVLAAIRGRLNPAVDAALIRLAEQAAETQALIGDLAHEISRECVRLDSGPTSGSQEDASIRAFRICLDCEKLALKPAVLIREVCRAAWRDANWPQQAMGADEWQKLAVLVVGGEAVRFHLPGGILAERQAGSVILMRSDLGCLP